MVNEKERKISREKKRRKAEIEMREVETRGREGERE